jgi:hypothetical protein
MRRNQCERCGEDLHPNREVWLGYDQRTHTYTDKPIPPEHDQGGFPFGRACARKALAEDARARAALLIDSAEYRGADSD